MILVTATFDAPVTGVTVADFNGGSAFPVEAGVSYSLAGGPTEYVLTTTVNQTPRTTKPLSFQFATASGAISPPIQATSAFSITYVETARWRGDHGLPGSP